MISELQDLPPTEQKQGMQEDVSGVAEVQVLHVSCEDISQDFQAKLQTNKHNTKIRDLESLSFSVEYTGIPNFNGNQTNEASNRGTILKSLVVHL